QQLELREESLASAALGHDEHVRVAQSVIERRERYELAVGSLKEHQRRIRHPFPWHLHRQQVGCVQGENILFPLIDLTQSGETGKEEALLRQCLRNAARAVHA